MYDVHIVLNYITIRTGSIELLLDTLMIFPESIMSIVRICLIFLALRLFNTYDIQSKNEHMDNL